MSQSLVSLLRLKQDPNCASVWTREQGQTRLALVRGVAKFIREVYS